MGGGRQGQDTAGDQGGVREHRPGQGRAETPAVDQSNILSLDDGEILYVNEHSIHSSSHYQVNATDLFDRYLYEPEYDEYIESGLPEFEVSKLSIDQSIQVSVK